MTHEDICTLEQSKALYTLGFDWHCHRIYNTFDALIGEASPFYTNNTFENMPLAPTLAQAAKWLREVNGLYILVRKIGDTFDSVIYANNANIPLRTSNYSQYEQALSVGIDRALEILKEEKR